MNGSAISRVTGTAIVLSGNDIDTDRIMPARFLKAITFSGLEDHVFEDDRHEAAARGTTHPFDDSGRRGARILIAGANFGCGSSREHAPRALYRWGLRAIIAESFAEIFAGNSLMIGLACAAVSPTDLDALRGAAGEATAEFTLDIGSKSAIARDISVPVQMPAATRHALMSGAWDATGLLLSDYQDVQLRAAAIPYIRGF